MATLDEVIGTVEIFFSYSQTDQTLRDDLEKHLVVLRRQGLING
jgi:hypothetical protein